MPIQSTKAALDRLQITKEQLLAVPQITPHLEHIMSSLAARGLPSDIWYYMEASPAPDVRKVLFLRKQLRKQAQKYFSIEMFCAASGINDPQDILQAVIRTIDRLNRYNASLRISSAQPEVVQKTIDVAMTDGGDRARELYMKVSGLLPQSRGPHTTIQVNQNASATSSPQAIVVQATPAESTIKRMADQLNAYRQLTQQVTEPSSITESVQDSILVEKDQ